MSFPIHGHAPLIGDEEARLIDALALVQADIFTNLYWIGQYAGTLAEGIERHKQDYLDHCEKMLNEQWRYYQKALALRRDHEQKLKEIRPNE